MTLLIIFFLSLSLSIVATPLLISYFTKQGIVDKPGEERRIHKVATPRMGGIVIIVTTLIMFFSFYADLNDARLFIIGLLIITIVGVIDDVIGLKYSYKFAFQILVAFIIMFDLDLVNSSLEIFTIPFPTILANLILLLFIVGTINSINLMDGLDGLVSGYSIPKFLILLGLSIIYHDLMLSILLVSLLGSIIGFLKYNANPASIFLGDTGSLSIGYFLVYSVLKLSTYKYYVDDTLNLTFAVIMLSVPILDTLKVMLLRIAHKQNAFTPDKTHLHHLLFGQNLRHKTVVFVLHLFSLSFIFVALLYYKESEKFGILLWLIFATLLLNARSILRYFQKQGTLTLIFNFLERQVGKFVVISKRNLVFFSTIPIACLLFFSAEHRQSYDFSVILTALFLGGTLFFISLFLNKRHSLTNHIFLYLNLSIFFVFSFFRSEFVVWDLLESHEILFVSIVILIFLIILFSFARKIVISKEQMVFSGFDLSIIVATIAIILADNFFLPKSYSFIVPSLLLTLILYLWLKIVISVNKKFDKTICYLSFSLPIILLIFSIK